MKRTLDCRSIVKESTEVLSWNEDLYLMRYRHPKEVTDVNMLVHMNMVSIVLQGKTTILDKGCKTIVPAGSSFFVKEGTYFGGERISDPDSGYEAILVFFSDAWLRSQVDGLFAGRNAIEAAVKNEGRGDMAVIPEDDLLASLVTQLKSCLAVNADVKRKQALLPLKIRELFQILISAPEGHHFETQLRSLDTFLNPDLVTLMQRYYKENISQEQYASLANVSVSTFKRKFVHTFKMNPCSWIIQRRLEEAYHLLRSSEKNISEIGYEVGFETPSHFISSFKEKYGNTPRQVRQQI